MRVFSSSSCGFIATTVCNVQGVKFRLYYAVEKRVASPLLGSCTRQGLLFLRFDASRSVVLDLALQAQLNSQQQQRAVYISVRARWSVCGGVFSIGGLLLSSNALAV